MLGAINDQPGIHSSNQKRKLRTNLSKEQLFLKKQALPTRHSLQA